MFLVFSVAMEAALTACFSLGAVVGRGHGSEVEEVHLKVLECLRMEVVRRICRPRAGPPQSLVSLAVAEVEVAQKLHQIVLVLGSEAEEVDLQICQHLRVGEAP